MFENFQKDANVFRIAILIKISERVAAARMANEPVSMRSGITEKFPPEIFFTPSIIIVGVPAPEILAPQEFRYSARAVISGSSAQFFKIVRPLASVAAISIDSVAVTEIFL